MSLTIVQQYPTPGRDNVQLQQASINLAIKGKEFPYFVDVEYTAAVDSGDARGASPFSMGLTLGEYKASGNITVHLKKDEEFKELIAPGKGPHLAVFFDLTVQYQEFGWDQVITDRLIGCKLSGEGKTHAAGNGVLVVKYPMTIQLIIPNDRPPLPGIVAP
jgi:hypothetical protein